MHITQWQYMQSNEYRKYLKLELWKTKLPMRKLEMSCKLPYHNAEVHVPPPELELEAP